MLPCDGVHLMQFTGLLHKHGKEGDVISFEHEMLEIERRDGTQGHFRSPTTITWRSVKSSATSTRT